MEILSKDSKDSVIHISYKKEKEGKLIFEFDEDDVPLKVIENMIKMFA